MPNTIFPAISVIIPVQNNARYFSECLSSVIMQTLVNIEILIIEDASTDESDAIAKAYADIDLRITIIQHKKTIGAGLARNEGIAMAKGEYIAFLDSDDLYPSEYVLEKLYRAAIEKNANICGGSLYKIDANGNIIDMKIHKQYFETEGWIYYRDYQHDGGFYRFLYRRDFLLKNNIFFPHYRRFQDPVFLVNAMIRAERFYALSFFCYAYRKNHKIIKWTHKKIKDQICALQDILIMSKFNNLGYLHYLMSKNFLDILSHKASKNEKFFLIFEIIKTIKIINWKMIKKENLNQKVKISIFKILYKILI